MREPGPTRQALTRLIDAGVTGSYQVLARAAGLPPDRARAALKEMSRCGKARAGDRRCAAAPAVYGPPAVRLDALAFVRQVWR